MENQNRDVRRICYICLRGVLYNMIRIINLHNLSSITIVHVAIGLGMEMLLSIFRISPR